MIKITAESKGNQTELGIKIEGEGKSIVTEAVHIMEQLPKRIMETDKSLFFYFLAEIAASDMFGVGIGPKNLGEAEDDDE